MFICSVVAILFLAKVQCSVSNYETLPQIGNNILPHETLNKKALQSNKILDCDDIYNVAGINEIQEFIEVFAARKDTTPFAILKMLQKRIQNKNPIEKIIFNSIDRVQIPEILNPPIFDANILPPIFIPPLDNGAKYSIPSNEINGENINEEDTNVVMLPVPLPQTKLLNRISPIIKTDILTGNENSGMLNNVASSVGRISQVIPAMFPLPMLKNNQLRPSFDAIIRVNSNDSLNPVNRDIVVTVSPLMTVSEALRQAEIKYQNVLGYGHETDIINFTHSSLMDCYMVNQINDITNNEEFAWKLSITDRNNQVIYNDFCLPSGKDVFVKPGTLITLSYIPL